MAGRLGGQDYWPDESRYNSSRDAVVALRHGQWDNAAQELLGHAQHTLFCWFGLLPALVESLVGHNLPSIAAAYFGLYSVLVIFLIWAISRRAGAASRRPYGLHILRPVPIASSIIHVISSPMTFLSA